jgi:hypothetical protein
MSQTPSTGAISISAAPSRNARRIVAFELEHDVARSRLALQGLAAPASRERLAAMLGDRLGGRRGVARVGVGIGHIDARDDVTRGHHGSL